MDTRQSECSCCGNVIDDDELNSFEVEMDDGNELEFLLCPLCDTSFYEDVEENYINYSIS
jgi:hypothetical protein